MSKRRICVVLTDRANYGRLWPVMKALQESDQIEMLTLCTGTMLLERFGSAEKVVESDGFTVNSRIYIELEGSVPTTMAKSLGFGIVEISTELNRLKPDLMLVIGDRYEALAAVMAAAYQNIPIAHVQGGEVSGSIDESARHAISKFSQIHFPSTSRAAEYLIRMGENPDYVYNVGCPSGDYILKMDDKLPEDVFANGIGHGINPDQDFLLVIYHPTTTEFGKENKQVIELLNALDELSHPTVWLWPNIDAGSDHIAKVLRRYREQNEDKWLHLVKNFEPIVFQKLLKKTICAVGNSSSFVRDSTFSGTPVVLVGERQKGREYGENLTPVPAISSEILKAVRTQIGHGRYSPSKLYGVGDASLAIARVLESVKLYKQKTLHYVNEESSQPRKTHGEG